VVVTGTVAVTGIGMIAAVALATAALSLTRTGAKSVANA
jgi:hypothetical protein